MTIPLKADLVHDLIRRRFGSVDNLVVEWEHRVATGLQKQGQARDRASVYRWISSGLPSKVDEVFGFAATLDVDPVALLAIDRKYVHEQFGRERRWFRLNRPRGTHLLPIWAIYSAEMGWPNQELAEAYYGRRWHVFDFAHDPAVISNVYAAIVFRDLVAGDPVAPRTYHFAYRRVGVSDKMWRPYGAVTGFEREVVLVSESGDYQSVDRTSGAPVVVETHFGPGPAEFRVVSLHAFHAAIEAPSTGRPCVRFGA